MFGVVNNQLTVPILELTDERISGALRLDLAPAPPPSSSAAMRALLASHC